MASESVMTKESAQTLEKGKDSDKAASTHAREGDASNATFIAKVDEEGEFPVGTFVPPPKKARKKINKNGDDQVQGRGLAMPKDRGTGFELYYADPPMTPAEAAQEEEIYSPLRPFHQRMEDCIQRYRTRRRIGPKIVRYFNHYLFLGGVDSSPRQFAGGPGKDEIENMDADEIRIATAIDSIHSQGGAAKFYRGEDVKDPDSGWTVDWVGVVAGYLSEAVPAMTGQNYTEMALAVAVVDNFLRYVLHHDVCPEYAEDLRKALILCEKADSDLPRAYRAFVKFPGQFNLAAIELFCPDFIQHYHDLADAFHRPAHFDPAVVFKVGVMLAGTDEQAGQLAELRGNLDQVRVVREEELDCEIVHITRARATMAQRVNSLSLKDDKIPLAPVGTMTVVPWRCEDGWFEGEIARKKPLSKKEHTFLLENKILQNLQPGTKLRLITCELNIGVAFIKQVHAVMVPWYTFLPQMLMVRFRDPQESDRPAPSAKDPNAAEAMGDYMGDDD